MEPKTVAGNLIEFRLSAPPPPPQTVPPQWWGGSLFGRLVRLALLTSVITLAYFIDSGIFTGIVILFIIVAPFEKIYPRQQGQRVRRQLVTTDINFFWLPGLALGPS